MYKLDRSAFKVGTVAEADNHASYYKTLSCLERLKITFYLNSVAYNFPINNPPKMDKSIFSARARN